MGGWQPLTTNESTQTQSLIRQKCNGHIPAMSLYTDVNVLPKHAHKHQRSFTPTHKQERKTKWGQCIKRGVDLILMPS